MAGTIEQIFHRQGEVVAAGQPIVALLPPENLKVRFFAPEALLAQLRVGETVSIGCDGCEQPVAATISFIAREPQFTPPVIYSLDQREKLVFLVEARVGACLPIAPACRSMCGLAPMTDELVIDVRGLTKSFGGGSPTTSTRGLPARFTVSWARTARKPRLSAWCADSPEHGEGSVLATMC
jgi:hypothetical protein